MALIIINNPKPPKFRHQAGYGRSDVATIPLNCKLTKRLVPLDPKFKNRRLPITPYKQSRENLETHFALVRYTPN